MSLQSVSSFSRDLKIATDFAIQKYQLAAVIRLPLDCCRVTANRVSNTLILIGRGLYQSPSKKIVSLSLLFLANYGVEGVRGQFTGSYRGNLKTVINSANTCYIQLIDKLDQGFTTTALWVPGGEETSLRFERNLGQAWTVSDFMVFGRSYYHHEDVWDFRSPLLLIKELNDDSHPSYQIIASMLDNGGWLHNTWMLRDDSVEKQTSTPSNPALISVDLPLEVSATTQGAAGAWQENPVNGDTPHVMAFFGAILEDFAYNFTTPPFEVSKGIEPNQAYFIATGESVLTVLDQARTSFKLISHKPATGERSGFASVSQLPRSYPYIFKPQTFATDDNHANTVVTVCATGPKKDGDTYSIDAAFINKETGEIYYAFQIAGGPTTGSPYYSLTTRQVGSGTYVATYRYEKNLWGVAFNKRGQMGVPFIINQTPIEEPGLAVTSFYQMNGDPVTKGCSAWQTQNKTVTATNLVLEDLPLPIPSGMPYPDTVLTVPQLPITTTEAVTTTIASAIAAATGTMMPIAPASPSSRSISREVAPSPNGDQTTILIAAITAVVLLVLVAATGAMAAVALRRRSLRQAARQHLPPAAPLHPTTSPKQPEIATAVATQQPPQYANAPAQGIAAYGLATAVATQQQTVLASPSTTTVSALPQANGSRPTSNAYDSLPKSQYEGANQAFEHTYDGTVVPLSGVSYGQLQPDNKPLVYSELGPDQT